MEQSKSFCAQRRRRVPTLLRAAREALQVWSPPRDDSEACGIDDPWYLRPSFGGKNVLWRPKVGLAAKERLHGSQLPAEICDVKVTARTCGASRTPRLFRQASTPKPHAAVSAPASISRRRTVCTDGSRQKVDLTSAGSSGFICSLDQRCLLELCKAQRQRMARRRLGSAASQFLLRVDDHRSDLLPRLSHQRLLCVSSCSTCTFLHECGCCHERRVASNGSLLPAIQIRGTAGRMEQSCSMRVSRQTSQDICSPARMAMYISGMSMLIAYGWFTFAFWA